MLTYQNNHVKGIIKYDLQVFYNNTPQEITKKISTFYIKIKGVIMRTLYLQNNLPML